MIWIKTEAGRVEIRSRARVRERAQRTLLLLIDGSRTQAMLLSDLAGISDADFLALQALGLIAPAPPLSPGAGDRAAPLSASSPATSPASPPAPAVSAAVPAAANTDTADTDTDTDADPAPLDYAQFTAMLTKLISSELGLRGFGLTLAVERAGTADELQAVAQRALTQIRERKGDAAAAAARRALYGR